MFLFMLENQIEQHYNYIEIDWNLSKFIDQFNSIFNDVISVNDIEKKYYADGEDAYAMKKQLLP